VGVLADTLRGLLRSVLQGAWAHWARVGKKTLNGCNSRFSKASFNDTSIDET